MDFNYLSHKVYKNFPMKFEHVFSNFNLSNNKVTKNKFDSLDPEQNYSLTKMNSIDNEENTNLNAVDWDIFDNFITCNENNSQNIPNEKDNNNLYFNNLDEKKEEKPKVFLIPKEKRYREIKNKSIGVKKGRRQKDAPLSDKVKHSKYAKDNIISKIINRFVESVFGYINKIYEDFKKIKNKKDTWLKRIHSNKYKVDSKDKKQKFLILSLRELFSSELNEERYNNFTKKNSKFYNRDNIDLLINEQEITELIEILNMTVEEMYKKYINNEIPECNLENDLIKMEEEDNEEREYITKYEEVALNLIVNFKKKRKQK